MEEQQLHVPGEGKKGGTLGETDCSPREAGWKNSKSPTTKKLLWDARSDPVQGAPHEQLEESRLVRGHSRGPHVVI